MAMMAITALALTSCAGEEDDIFDKTAAERLNESSAKYSARLEAQPNGWAMQYYPTYRDESPFGSGYLILMRFNPDFSVDVSMDNRFSNNAYASATSGWEVIKDNGPVLTFNTYNQCMHAFSDPEDIPWTEDSEQSEGCGGDYEFIIVDAPEDASYMMLKGKKRNTYNLLTPIEEGVDYAEYLADVKKFHNTTFPETELVSNLIHFGDSVYRMDGSNDGLPNIYPYNADAIANESFNPFLITKRGEDYYLRFRDAFEKDFMEGTLQELRYDSIQQVFIGTDNADFRITGFDPSTFFYDNMLSSHVWQFIPATDVTGSMAEVLAIISADFAARKYTLENVKFSGIGNDATIILGLKQGTKSVNLTYLYDVTFEDGKTTLSYREPYTTKSNKQSEQILSIIPSILDFLNAANGTYTAEKAAPEPFNLGTLKVTHSSGSTITVQYGAK